MPKYIVNGSGDQFFCPDSSQFYFDDLQGEKHLRYVPNTDHGVDSSIDAVTSMVAFYQMIIAGRPRPRADVDLRGRWLDPRDKRRDAAEGHPLAGDQSERPRLPRRDDRQGVHGAPN